MASFALCYCISTALLCYGICASIVICHYALRRWCYDGKKEGRIQLLGHLRMLAQLNCLGYFHASA
ncbi:hypothetical protein Csa_014583, partial [Cucumis sativus]